MTAMQELVFSPGVCGTVCARHRRDGRLLGDNPIEIARGQRLGGVLGAPTIDFATPALK